MVPRNRSGRRIGGVGCIGYHHTRTWSIPCWATVGSPHFDHRIRHHHTSALALGGHVVNYSDIEYAGRRRSQYSTRISPQPELGVSFADIARWTGISTTISTYCIASPEKCRYLHRVYRFQCRNHYRSAIIFAEATLYTSSLMISLHVQTYL